MVYKSRIKKELLIFAIAISLAIAFSSKLQIDKGVFSKYGEAVFLPFSWEDGILFLVICCAVYLVCLAVRFLVCRYQNGHREAPRRYSRRVFLCLLVVLLVLWLPCLLTYYPGGIYSDTAASVWMATGEVPLGNHHPILYTLLWKGMFVIGGLFSLSYEGIFFLFTCGTAVCMALTAAYFLYSCWRHGISGVIIVLMTAFYALYPLVPLYIVSLWKDTPFAISILGLSTALMNTFWDEETEKRFFEKKNLIPFLTFGILSCFLRNNGIYGFIILAFLLFLNYIRKERAFVIRLGITLLSTILVIAFIRFPLFDRLGWNNDEKVESLGIPLQQVGYILNSSDEVTDRQLAFLGEIMPVETWKEEYQPMIVDNIKWSKDFNLGFLNVQWGTFLQVYGELVLKNPVDAFRGYALATVGFWDPARQENVAYVNTFMWKGLPWEMKDIPEEQWGISLKPVYDSHIHFSSALYGWVILFFTAVGMSIQRKRRVLIPVIPVLGVWLTLLLATPVAFSLRYLFPAVLVVPLAFVLMVREPRPNVVGSGGSLSDYACKE